MQYQYEITPDDFVAFNVYFAETDPVIRKTQQKLRRGTTMLVFFGGLIFMLALDHFTPVAVILYGALAAFWFWLYPRWVHRNLKKNVDRTIKSASNKSICGSKTFTMDETSCTLTGENENSTYEYSAFQKTVDDGGHIYLFLDDISALIIPARAFPSDDAKAAFLADFTARMQRAKSANAVSAPLEKPDAEENP